MAVRAALPGAVLGPVTYGDLTAARPRWLPRWSRPAFVPATGSPSWSRSRLTRWRCTWPACAPARCSFRWTRRTPTTRSATCSPTPSLPRRARRGRLDVQIGSGPDWEDVPRGSGDPAALLYTSGTTGRPKGALLTHGNLAHNARTLVDAWGFTASDNVLHVLPLHHTHGLFVALHCALASGSGDAARGRFDAADAVALMPRCTVLMGVPTHYVRLLGEPSSTRIDRRLRLILWLGAAVRVDPRGRAGAHGHACSSGTA